MPGLLYLLIFFGKASSNVRETDGMVEIDALKIEINKLILCYFRKPGATLYCVPGLNHFIGLKNHYS